MSTNITGAGIFPCPTCGEMIYADSRICRFCSAPVDRAAAEMGVRLQAKVNNACNHAKMLRHCAVSMWVFFLISFLLFRAANWAFFGLMIAIPFWLIYWQFTFANLKTNDPDFERAKHDRLVAFFIWLPAPVVVVILAILIGI